MQEDKKNMCNIVSINKFRGDYNFLSNFYEIQITYDGLTYNSAEAAFQAQKCVNNEDKLQFTEMTPVKSKRAGRKVQLRSDWDSVKVDIMQDIVYEKFKQNPELTERLLDTKNIVLIEGNNWNDTFWGVSTRTRKGKNHLGQILMKVRDDLRRSDENE